jgi:hypothetical protein
LLARTYLLLPEYGTVSEPDRAAEIAGKAQKNRIAQGNGRNFPDPDIIRLFAQGVCALPDKGCLGPTGGGDSVNEGS